MNKVVYCALATFVTGCASNSGVVPIGPATFMVSRQAATGFSGSGTLKADALQEANQYCLSQDKKLQVVNTAEAQPPYIFGNFPKAEVQFKCLDANDQAPSTSTTENSASPKPSSTGSGFVVSASGHLLTNHHVVNGCTNLKIRDSAKLEHDVTVVATDARNDLALLQTSTAVTLPTATFRANGSVESGESVVSLGYPLVGWLASEVNVSFGYVSATAGLADDTSKLQISAPVQPGNSGGPLLDQSGNLIGVVVAKLDAIKVAKVIGDIPQNINFAVKGEVAQVFLNAHKVKFKTAAQTKKLENTDIVSRGREFTVLVECYK